MGQKSNVEWCDSSLNLESGCDGCELWNPKAGVKICYAGKIIERYGGKPGWPDRFEKPKLFVERLDQALKWSDLTGRARPGKHWLNGLPRIVFLNDMGDTFTESLPIDWMAPLLPRMADSPHQWLCLTKRANRMEEFSKAHPFPNNFWLMTSITCNANLNRIEHLLRCRGGSVRGISYEPATEYVDFRPYFSRGLNWVVCGGESGFGARAFETDWARSIISDCKIGGCRVFIKQLGSDPLLPEKTILHPPQRRNLVLIDSKGSNWREWPHDIRIREFPA